MVNFSSNSAQNGGAMYFVRSTLTLEGTNAILATSYNYASQYGGAICNDDDIHVKHKCNNTKIPILLPLCFLRLKKIISNTSANTLILSHNNTVGINGTFLYGGLLHRCWLNFEIRTVAYEWLRDVVNNNSTTKEVTSQPYQLCFCDNDQEYSASCSGVKNIEKYRNQTLSVYLLAIDQTGSAISTLIHAETTTTGRLQHGQNCQNLSYHCSKLTYTIESGEDQENLTLYSDGLCEVIINVTLSCPDAFTKSEERCECEERLKAYHADCVIGENFLVIDKAACPKLWMRALYDNDTYKGLILSDRCPPEYCKQDQLSVPLHNLNYSLDNHENMQCDSNRSQVLCGACATDYSLMLGGYKCHICTNRFLVLLLPFAAAGIALVVFLSFLRLTVATGMINSIILYANIVQVNKYLFFANTRNILTVFIAWLNLDLGFQTCFYDGMDAYAQTWLQFAFPFYVWILISLIIVTSRYSVTVTRLIGSNPIAVLATLLLMSYTKTLKIVIEVYSFTRLDYPDNKTDTVWLKDANVPYLQSKHLLLTVVTSMVLIFLFLPYTFLLLLGYKLYWFSSRKYLRWLNRLKPLLDSYYAPYKKYTRYWTGFLLLIRCVLYIVDTFLLDKNTTLALIIAFTVIIVVMAWLHGRVYKTIYVDIIEASVYLNLIILLAATSIAETTPIYASCLLVGIVFVTMIGVIVYHFHLLYTIKLFTWLKRKALIKPHKFNDPRDSVASDGSAQNVSSTVIELREPLLED